MKNQRSLLLLSFFTIASFVANASQVTLKYRYTDATTNKVESGEGNFSLDTAQSSYSDVGVLKTMMVLDMAKTIETAIEDFHSACQPELIDDTLPPLRPFPPINPIQPINPGPPVLRTLANTSVNSHIVFPMPSPIPEPPIVPIEPNDECVAERSAIKAQLLEAVENFSERMAQDQYLYSGEKLYETLDLMRKLASNMDNVYIPHTGWPYYRTAEMASSIGGGFNVTTGGAQNFGYVRKQIEDGLVPFQGTFDQKSFMGEFDLSLTHTQCDGDMCFPGCDQKICVFPAYNYNAVDKKLFVQVGMDTNLAHYPFVRNPLNVSLVIDISGSMSATDGTEKSRLEWAKEAALKTLASMMEGDYVSLVVFDTKSEVVFPPTRIDNGLNKAALENAIRNLETKGSTNLEAGLKNGFQLVSETALGLEFYDHRVILISDAGLNTGVVEDSQVLSLITDYANENIGLTAIGLGENFNQDFILGITKAKGGNYIYVHSGRDMFKYFQSFDLLVTPIAYQLKASLHFDNLDASLLNTHGVPSTNNQNAFELINVQTLFLTNQGGGALVFEYQVN